ncbi:hypothetical protein, partial [Streptococcus merionis]|uniref:hypothetical protein n=1 Tax=Streptococcus merionis TaxID=400065 RepID=UPI0026ECD64F
NVSFSPIFYKKFSSKSGYPISNYWSNSKMNPVIAHRKAKALLPTKVEELYSIRLKITQEG